MKTEHSRMSPSITAYCILLLFSPAGHVARVAAGQTDLLNIVKQKNLDLSGPYVVSFSMQEQVNLHDPNQGLVLMDCRAAQDERGTLAVRITYYYEKNPVFVAPGSGMEGNIDYLGGNLIVWRKTEKYVLSSRGQNTVLDRLKCFQVAPDSRVAETSENVMVLRRPIGSADSCPEFRHFQRSVGQGYAEHLTRLVSTESVEGLVKMTVEGSYWIGSPEGVWELSVAPNSDYVIRSASFRRKGADSPMMTATNSGLLANANMRIARRGTYERAGLLKVSVEAGDLTVGLSDAQRLIDEVAGVVGAPLPAGASILDLRGPRPVWRQ